MYKLTIEKKVGEITSKTTIETEDVELVKLVLTHEQVLSVHSDVDNLNIDPEWQELLQWWKNKKDSEKSPYEELIKEMNKRQTEPASPLNPMQNPHVLPYGTGDRGWQLGDNPFTVTC